MSAGPRYIGVTVLCDYVLSEGVDAVLENLHRVGASAVAVNPTVTTEASEGQEGASWQPPSDGGSSPVRSLYRHSLVEPHAIAMILSQSSSIAAAVVLVRIWCTNYSAAVSLCCS